MSTIAVRKFYKVTHDNYLCVDEDGNAIWQNSTIDTLGNVMYYSQELSKYYLITKKGIIHSDIPGEPHLLGNGKYFDTENQYFVYDCEYTSNVYQIDNYITSFYNQYLFNVNHEIINTDDFSTVKIACPNSICKLTYFDGNKRAILINFDTTFYFTTDRPYKPGELIYIDSFGNYTILELFENSIYRFTLYMGQQLELPYIRMLDLDGKNFTVIDNIICMYGSRIEIVDNPKCTNFEINYMSAQNINVNFTLIQIKSMSKLSKPTN